MQLKRSILVHQLQLGRHHAVDYGEYAHPYFCQWETAFSVADAEDCAKGVWDAVDTSPDLGGGVSSKPSKWLLYKIVAANSNGIRKSFPSLDLFPLTFKNIIWPSYVKGGGDCPHRPLYGSATGCSWDWCRSDEFTERAGFARRSDVKLAKFQLRFAYVGWLRNGRQLMSRNCLQFPFPHHAEFANTGVLFDTKLWNRSPDTYFFSIKISAVDMNLTWAHKL